MKKLNLFSGSALIATLLLSACGGDKKPTAPLGEMNREQATAYLSSFSEQTLALANTTSPTILQDNFMDIPANARREITKRGLQLPARATGNALCKPTATPAQLVDADGDTIPLTASYAFDCNYANTGYEIRSAGTLGISDQNDTAPGGAFPMAGFQATFKDFAVTLITNGSTIATRVNGDYTLNVTGKAQQSTASLTLEMSGGEASGKAKYWIDTTNNANHAEKIRDGGSSLVSGFFKLEAGDADYILEVASSGLTYGGCPSPNDFFNGGEITFRDGSQNVLKLTYNGCNRVATYNNIVVSQKETTKP